MDSSTDRPRRIVSTTGSPVVLEFESELVAGRASVWARVTTMEGVNAELRPFVRMTHPPALPSLAHVDFAPGEVLLKSWVLLFGIVPCDRHSLALTRVTNGTGFLEDSTSWLQRAWHHERTLADSNDGGCIVVDRLTIEPRISATAPLVRMIVGALFTHRHRRLRAWAARSA
jgi:hypothetical protein